MMRFDSDKFLRFQQERFDKAFNRIGCLSLVVDLLLLLTLAGALLSASNIWAILKGK